MFQHYSEVYPARVQRWDKAANRVFFLAFSISSFLAGCFAAKPNPASGKLPNGSEKKPHPQKHFWNKLG